MNTISTHAVVPAINGWFVIGVASPEEGLPYTVDDVYKEPICAWCIVIDRTDYPAGHPKTGRLNAVWARAEPVVLDMRLLEDEVIIMSPDGTITLPEDRYFINIRAFLEWKNEEREGGGK